jgi:hypothetical protein
LPYRTIWSSLVIKVKFLTISSFVTVSSERTQEKVWSDGWKHFLDYKNGKKDSKGVLS